MLSAGAGAVGDGRSLSQTPETIAIVHERLGAHRKLISDNGLVSLLKGIDERIVLIEAETVADELKIRLNIGFCVALQASKQLAEFAFHLLSAGARQPAAGAFEPAFLWILVVNLATMDLADEN